MKSETKIKTKWEFIRDASRKLGHEDLAEIAEKIDQALIRIYGEGEHTKEWAAYIPGLPFPSQTDLCDIYRIATSGSYCTACTATARELRMSLMAFLSGDYCNSCKFARETGGIECNEADEGSLFGSFLSLLNQKRIEANK